MTGSLVTSDPASHDAGLFVEASAAPHRRHLLGLEGMGRDAILEILDLAQDYSDRFARSPHPTRELEGVTVCNAFFEGSTRTRVSFELAEKRLGALTLSISENGASI